MLTSFCGFKNDTPLLHIRSNPKELILNHLQGLEQFKINKLRCSPSMQMQPYQIFQ